MIGYLIFKFSVFRCMDFHKFSFVLRGSIWKKIVLALDSQKIPSQIKNETKLEDSNVSRTLKELEKEGIVRCVTPNEKTGRIYELTKVGEEIKKELSKYLNQNKN